jgi:hypothetical protein
MVVGSIPTRRTNSPAIAQRRGVRQNVGLPDSIAPDTDPASTRFWCRPLLVGVVHGLAGSAAVALLVLTTIRDPIASVAYLFVFGIGTVAGMAAITTMIALPFASGTTSAARTHRRLQLIPGLVSVAFGGFIAHKIGIVGGAFGADPHWTPDEVRPERNRSMAMRRFVAGVAAIAGVYLIVQMWPDVARYVRMQSM